MAKELEEGELEDGELPEDEAQPADEAQPNHADNVRIRANQWLLILAAAVAATAMLLVAAVTGFSLLSCPCTAFSAISVSNLLKKSAGCMLF